MRLGKRQRELLTKLTWLQPGIPGCISNRYNLAACEKMAASGLVRECEPMTRRSPRTDSEFTVRRFEITDEGRAALDN